MSKIKYTKVTFPSISSQVQQAKQIIKHMLYQNCYVLGLRPNIYKEIK